MDEMLQAQPRTQPVMYFWQRNPTTCGCYWWLNKFSTPDFPGVILSELVLRIPWTEPYQIW